MLTRNSGKIKLVLSFISIFVISMLLTFAYLDRQYIFDKITVYQFKPSSDVTKLIERTGVNDYGKFLYLASQPVIESTQNFNLACANNENISSILGCYNNGRIYIYDVTDTQLDGVREVTAVHEVMHAAYNRLNIIEKSKIDSLLEDEYRKLEGNKELVDRMSFYEKIEPGQRHNELHSVIGTEVADISPELERYYDKYFSNRQDTVTLNQNYISVFKKLDDRRIELEGVLSILGPEINSKKVQYETDVRSINEAVLGFNTRANNGDFLSVGQFNDERDTLSNQITSLQSIRDAISQDIANYNELYKEYDSSIYQLKKLYDSIDSTLAPSPSI